MVPKVMFTKICFSLGVVLGWAPILILKNVWRSSNYNACNWENSLFPLTSMFYPPWKRFTLCVSWYVCGALLIINSHAPSFYDLLITVFQNGKKRSLFRWNRNFNNPTSKRRFPFVQIKTVLIVLAPL